MTSTKPHEIYKPIEPVNIRFLKFILHLKVNINWHKFNLHDWTSKKYISVFNSACRT